MAKHYADSDGAGIVVVVLSSEFRAAEPASDATTKKDAERIQGTWKLVEVLHDGQNIAPAMLALGGQEIWTITEKELIISINGKNQKAERYTIDSTKAPKQFDSVKDVVGKNNLTVGIYELKGDQLTLCVFSMVETKDTRPDSFQTKRATSVPSSFFNGKSNRPCPHLFNGPIFMRIVIGTEGSFHMTLKRLGEVLKRGACAEFVKSGTFYDPDSPW